jgi:hypothetical protein
MSQEPFDIWILTPRAARFPKNGAELPSSPVTVGDLDFDIEWKNELNTVRCKTSVRDPKRPSGLLESGHSIAEIVP